MPPTSYSLSLSLLCVPVILASLFAPISSNPIVIRRLRQRPDPLRGILFQPWNSIGSQFDVGTVIATSASNTPCRPTSEPIPIQSNATRPTKSGQVKWSFPQPGVSHGGIASRPPSKKDSSLSLSETSLMSKSW
eukprot:731626_1